MLTRNAQKPGSKESAEIGHGKLSESKSMLRFVVAIINICTVVVCVMTGGTRHEFCPTQL